MTGTSRDLFDRATNLAARADRIARGAESSALARAAGLVRLAARDAQSWVLQTSPSDVVTLADINASLDAQARRLDDL